MASIKLDSKIVIEACKNAGFDHMTKSHKYMAIQEILQLSKYAQSYGGEMHIDQQDFALIGDFLPNHKD